MKGCAGLGNRFITLMKALQYAKLSGRYIYVDWKDGMFGEIGHNVFEEYFELDFIKKATYEDVLIKLNEGGIYPSCLKIHDLDKPIYPESNVKSTFGVYTPKMARITPYKVFLSLFPIHKIGYFLGLQSFQQLGKMSEGMNWWKVIRTIGDGQNFPLGSNLWPWLKADIVLYADFRPYISMKDFPKRIKLNKDFEKKVNDKATDMNLKNAIGVHVRYTDKKPATKLKSLLEHLKSLPDSNECSIFLCTDNPFVENEFRKRFQVITVDKSFPETSGKGIHIWAALQEDSVIKKQMFEDSLMDMWLLSKCKRLFWQGNSSFSYISTLLKADKTTITDWTTL